MNPFLLWGLFELKHFLADYIFQGPYMLRKFRPGWDFIIPLAAHCTVHSLFTLAILLYFTPKLWALTLVEFVIHFVMDHIKASPNILGRFSALSKNEFTALGGLGLGLTEGRLEEDAKVLRRNNTFFWWSLGFDQMVHNLTYLFIVWRMVNG